METIFIGIPAFNEEDIHQTIKTALGKAANPLSIHMGVVLHYPKGNFPDLSIYPNVKVIQIDEPMGLGTGLTRDLAASLYEGEDYYLQIDAHTIFRKNWDYVLKANYKELKKVTEKPIISSYVPFWYKDKKTGQSLTMRGDTNFDVPELPWVLVPKNKALDTATEEWKSIVYGVEALETPAASKADFSKNDYQEQHLIAGHFLFTSASYLEDVPFDPLTTYHEENTAPMRAWTRGYRIFTIKDHVLWTREMFKGRDVPDSWRSNSVKEDENGNSFFKKINEGSLRNKEVLTGKVLGIWGAPSQELLDKYEEASGLDYKTFYKEMYEVVEATGDKYFAARNLYDLDKKLNG